MSEKNAGTEEYGKFMKRLARSYGRKAVAGEIDATALTQMAEIQAMLDEQMAEVVRALRSEKGGSHSWSEIGDALGITRAAAFKRYGGDDADARKQGGQPSHLR